MINIFYSTWHNLQVNIPQKVIDEMQDECKRANNMETGGALLGYYDGTKAVVTSITKPDKNQELEPRNFDRPALGKEFLDEQYENGRRYIGDWHSHPNNSPNSSLIDNEQMIEFVCNEKLNCPEPILIILGGNNINGFEISAQVYKKNGEIVEKLPFEQHEKLKVKE
jgi:integrative and conjugative element protein (TIGR02256 family)